MKIIVLGLSVSSSWGNGHATTYRALIGALSKQHDVLFLERDQPWYAAHRDLPNPGFCRLALYSDLRELDGFRGEFDEADAVIVGSYVVDGPQVIRRIKDWVRGAFCFYDIDTPVTLSKLLRGEEEYLSPDTIALFDLYFSFAGGPTLARLQAEFGARAASALYCSVDASRYYPHHVERRWDLGYIGTYSIDRQPSLERLLLEPARRLPQKRFVVAGPQYPADVVWPANVERIEHLPPEAHVDFYNAQAWTLNVTRADMVEAGYSPSVRLFEASACGTPIISDPWPGLETIFQPREEIVIASRTEEVVDALAMPEQDRQALGTAARARCLAAHTAAHRADELVSAIEEVVSSRRHVVMKRHDGALV